MNENRREEKINNQKEKINTNNIYLGFLKMRWLNLKLSQQHKIDTIFLTLTVIIMTKRMKWFIKK